MLQAIYAAIVATENNSTAGNAQDDLPEVWLPVAEPHEMEKRPMAADAHYGCVDWYSYGAVLSDRAA
jgi:hypothetical protein